VFLFCGLILAVFISVNRHKDSLPEDSRILWNKTVTQYIKNDLWLDAGNMYDGANALMVPLHAAFIFEYKSGQREFSEHFTDFMKNDASTFLTTDDDIDLSREHYLYLASRFIALAASNKHYDLIPEGLPVRLKEEIAILWNKKPVRWCDGLIFGGGIRERLDWKLAREATPVSYCLAITDQEVFLFAIAADIRIYEKQAKLPEDPLLDEILGYSRRTIEKYASYTDNGGWLFQPGIWRDHPDYVYAGNGSINSNLKPIPKDNIAEDSSHSHRWPIWLVSLIQASEPNSKDFVFYKELKGKLEKQFFDKVVAPPTEQFRCYRVNNYMDGYNGIYRYNYATAGESNGYGPYELSGILVDGWWGLFGTKKTHDLYANIAKCFPLDEIVVKVYVGPNTNRVRNEYVRWPDFFQNGFGELNVKLVSKMTI